MACFACRTSACRAHSTTSYPRACASGGLITSGRSERAMAEDGKDLFSKSLQKLDDELTCPLCTQHFREPKVLPCHHFYCKVCIADLVKSADGRPFNCPECRCAAQAADNDPEW